MCVCISCCNEILLVIASVLKEGKANGRRRSGGGGVDGGVCVVMRHLSRFVIFVWE